MEKLRICVVTGTRPEIIKVCVLLAKLKQDDRFDLIFIHSGQHYDENMYASFIKELNLSAPDYDLSIGSHPNSIQTGKMLISFHEIIEKEKPHIILAQGDTNTVFASALTAFKNNIPFAHLEAGIRSFDLRMPEEINRVLTGACSLYNFAPTEKSAQYLLNEGIYPERIYVVGNTIVDAVKRNSDIARKESEILKKHQLREGEYILITMHRPSNVDHPEILTRILKTLVSIPNITKVYPVHPRAEKNIKQLDIYPTIEKDLSFKLIPPCGYLDFLNLIQNSKFIITDSGGLQEEAVILQKPCLTLRENTERPESVEIGANILIGNDNQKLEKYTNQLLSNPDFYESMVAKTNPFGSGDTSDQIIEVLWKSYSEGLMQIPYLPYDNIPTIKLRQGPNPDMTVQEIQKEEKCKILEVFDNIGEMQIPRPELKITKDFFYKAIYY